MHRGQTWRCAAALSSFFNHGYDMIKIAEGKISDLQKQIERNLARAASIGIDVHKAILAPEAALYCAAIVAEVTDSLIDIKESVDWLDRAQGSPQLTQAIAVSSFARIDQRIKHNVDLLNQASQVIDGDIDIWGRAAPRGGLWDK
jgi:hypothetical protein